MSMCLNEGDVTGNLNVGGLIGAIGTNPSSEVKISNSGARCSVNYSGSTNGIGGLYGYRDSSATYKFMIVDCFFNGTLTNLTSDFEGKQVLYGIGSIEGLTIQNSYGIAKMYGTLPRSFKYYWNYDGFKNWVYANGVNQSPDGLSCPMQKSLVWLDASGQDVFAYLKSIGAIAF